MHCDQGPSEYPPCSSVIFRCSPVVFRPGHFPREKPSTLTSGVNDYSRAVNGYNRLRKTLVHSSNFCQPKVADRHHQEGGYRSGGELKVAPTPPLVEIGRAS